VSVAQRGILGGSFT